MTTGQLAEPRRLTCVICGTAFESRTPNAPKTCSRPCYRTNASQRKRETGYYEQGRHKRYDRVCGFCEEPFKGLIRQVYCSRSCLTSAGWRSGRLKPDPALFNRWAYYLRRTYGLTVEQYEAMLEEQGGGCAVCGTEVKDGSNQRLCVDHDHATGRVRGLLCQPCNRAMGLLGDSEARLLAAADYLARS